MKIRWNEQNAAFELEFSDFQSDLEAAKAANFKTTGPPDWVWYSVSLKSLKYLKENRPKSGLKITEEALLQFKIRTEQEEEKDRIVKQFKDAKARSEGKSTEDEKAEKRKQKEAKRIADGKPKTERKTRQAKGGQNHSETRYEVTFTRYQPPPPPSTRCNVCRDPIYYYESDDICLWCEKIQDEDLNYLTNL